MQHKWIFYIYRFFYIISSSPTLDRIIEFNKFYVLCSTENSHKESYSSIPTMQKGFRSHTQQKFEMQNPCYKIKPKLFSSFSGYKPNKDGNILVEKFQSIPVDDT